MVVLIPDLCTLTDFYNGHLSLSTKSMSRSRGHSVCSYVEDTNYYYASFDTRTYH